MKTVPTLCATSTGIGISVLGLALGRPDLDNSQRRRIPPNNNTNDKHNHDHNHNHLSVDPGARRPRSYHGSFLAPPSDMTSTATCTVQVVDTYAAPTRYCSPFAFSARQSLHSASSHSIAPPKNASDNARAMLKKDTRLKDGRTMPSGSDDSGDASPLSSSFTQHQSWLKRISFSSRDSSQHSNSRAEFGLLSPSMGSVAQSAAGSTTPMIPSLQVPPTSAPNKLVKRSTSISRERSGSISKIPMPTLKRPATSRGRSATLQERRATAFPKAEDAFTSPSTDLSTDSHWRNFFTPRMAFGASLSSRRRNSTGIPNPIKRVYPDRKYRPVLLSAKELINAAAPEFDTDADERLEPLTSSRLVSGLSSRFASSPHIRPATMHVPISSNRLSQASIDVRDFSYDSLRQSEIKEVEGDEEECDQNSRAELASRRSFSISDLLPTDAPTPKAPVSGNKPPVTKYRRRGVRSSSGTRSSMGNRPSISNDESEPLAKRCDVINVAEAPASPSPSSPLTEIDLNLSSHMTQPATITRPSDAKLTDRKGSAEHNAPSSPISCSAVSRPSHQSISYSEFTSNNTGSDSEVRSGDDEGLDSQSETIYDSVRTRGTKNSPSGRRGPPIETIFGESPPFHIHGKHTMLRDFLQQGPLHDHGYSLKPRHSIIHEEDSISTPSRSGLQQSPSSSSAFQLKSSPLPASISSSPPAMPSLLDLRRSSERFLDTDDDQESSWSFGGDEDEEELPIQNRFAHLGISTDLLSPFPMQSSSSAATTPQRPVAKFVDKDTRSSIFDWSEQQPMDKSPGTNSPPRPKTVHGKKDAENRGSRSVGRRAPSGVHARSQSVPVAQEADGKRSQVVTNKFGTWGIGSKGVTEDWNEDFDFGEAQSAMTTLAASEEKRLDSGVGMFVPKSIRDQQTNVLANIGLLRDWGLLIEELKELKGRAATLELLNEENAKMWNEVDAMIDLADHESDEHTLAPRYSPPSSPSFNYDAFDEPLPAPSSIFRPPPETIDFPMPESPSDAGPSIFDFEDGASSPHIEHEFHITPATPRRPRKDSEAVARSVIEALQQKRVASDPGPAIERLDKVHFDTATLKRIIPYVQELRDRVKKVIRDAEDLLPSPRSIGSIGSIGSNRSRSLRRKLRDPQESPTLRRRSRRSTNTVENMSSDDGFQSPAEDLAARMRMTMVI